MEQASRESLAVAWHTARFTVMGMNGKLPALAPLLQERQSATSDIRAQLEAVSKVTGIKFQPATPATIAAFRRPQEPRG